MSLVPYITTPPPPISYSKNIVDKSDIYIKIKIGVLKYRAPTFYPSEQQ